jgi:hypothetical protein
MIFWVHISRVTHVVMRASVNALVASVIVLNVAATPPASAQNSSKGGQDHNKKDECPPAPQNCDDVRRIAYKNALASGYANNNGNGIPDVMERAYQVGFNDCSTGNAHVACMFNDNGCEEESGKLLGLRSQSAWHMTTLYRGPGGKEFECDFTPQSSGIFIRNRADTRVGAAFPDAGESIDPQYAKDGCETNGASSSALNPGGGLFGGGGGSMDMMMMMAIMSLLNQQRNQDNAQPSTDGEPAQEEVVLLTPTATPTPTPSPVPDSKSVSKQSSTTISDTGIVSPSSLSSIDGGASSQDKVEGGYKVEGIEASDELPKAEWEDKRDGMF